ncbi:MAG: hypothetical protein R3D03_01295 [Geminicoccaceae bacterium]
MGLAGTVPGLIFVHLVYGIGFDFYFRNYYAAFPNELVRAAQIDGAEFFTIFRRIMLRHRDPSRSSASSGITSTSGTISLFGASFSDFDSQPMTVALNNLVQSSTA